MARFAAAVALALLGAAAAATEGACADGQCPAEGEEAAMLQHAAAQATKANKTEVEVEVATPHCTTTPAATCGNPGIKCFLDTSGCSSSGGGLCCNAAGSSTQPQCRYCGTGSCPACPGTPATPMPTWAPAPTAAPTSSYCPPGSFANVAENGYCEFSPGNPASGTFYGCCIPPLVCKPQYANTVGGYNTCQPAR